MGEKSLKVYMLVRNNGYLVVSVDIGKMVLKQKKFFGDSDIRVKVKRGEKFLLQDNQFKYLEVEYSVENLEGFMNLDNLTVDYEDNNIKVYYFSECAVFFDYVC